MVNNYALQNIETLRFWCQKVLPLVYDDSLSYYEVLCKVVKKINELIDNDKEQNEAIIDLNEQIGALAEAQTEQYTELSGAIADEIARAMGQENDLAAGLLNLEHLLDLETQRAEAAETALNTALGAKEDKSNKVTSMSASSTDNQYPSAKAVWDALQNIQPSGGGDVVFVGASATYADVIDYIAPGDPAERKVVIYVDSMGINMLATEWDDNAQSVTFSAVVGDVLYTRTLTFNNGWSALGYKDIQALLDDKLSLSGGTMTGAITMPSNVPINNGSGTGLLIMGNANYTSIGNTATKFIQLACQNNDIFHNRGGNIVNVLDGANTGANVTLAGTENNLTSLKLNGTTYKVLPAVTGSDVGKFLRVDAGGDIVAETVPNANTASF